MDDDDPKIEIKTIYRRQDNEGPINDSWTDLSFQIDHETGELLVVEGRKEWIGGAGPAQRTYYVQPCDQVNHDDWNITNTVDANDQLRLTVTNEDKARYETAPHQRVVKYTHPELTRPPASDRKEYLRSQTKWNGYDFNNQCYVDLVIDEVDDEGTWRKKERICLRVVSRTSEPPVVWVENSNEEGIGVLEYQMRPGFKDRDGIWVQDSEEAFTDNEINLWPREDMEVPKELDEILCPGGRAGKVKAKFGEEGIVYTVGPTAQNHNCGGQGEERALVFLSFEPSWGFEGMKRINGERAIQRKQPGISSHDGDGKKRKAHAQDYNCEAKEYNRHGMALADGLTGDAIPPSDRDYKLNPAPAPSPSHTKALERVLWKEKAKYLSIVEGYWLGSPRVRKMET